MYSAKSNRNRHYLANTLKISALSLLLFSAACTADNGTADTNKETKPSGETTPTAAAVYDLAVKEAQALDSYAIESKTSYTVEQPAAEGAEAPDPTETAIDIVGDVRGEGYFFGIELVKDKATKETFNDEESNRLLRDYLSPALWEAGLYCRADDRGDPVIQLAPPLTIGESEFAEIGGILRSVLKDASSKI